MSQNNKYCGKVDLITYLLILLLIDKLLYKRTLTFIENVMILHYEEAMKDVYNTVRKVAGHINRPINKENIQIISDYLKHEVIY